MSDSPSSSGGSASGGSATATSGSDKKQRILVVEDEPLVRDLVALNLGHAG